MCSSPSGVAQPRKVAWTPTCPEDAVLLTLQAHWHVSWPSLHRPSWTGSSEGSHVAQLTPGALWTAQLGQCQDQFCVHVSVCVCEGEREYVYAQYALCQSMWTRQSHNLPTHLQHPSLLQLHLPEPSAKGELCSNSLEAVQYLPQIQHSTCARRT